MTPVSSNIREGKALKVVSISEMAVSRDPNEILVTYSLGSCIGLTLYDPKARVAGLLHCMLPLSRTNPAKAMDTPCMFADTGVALLLQAVFDLGARRTDLFAKVAGGAVQFSDHASFNVGERNLAVVRKVLWKNDILLNAEDVGGNKPRSVFLHVDTGRTLVKRVGREKEI